VGRCVSAGESSLRQLQMGLPTGQETDGLYWLSQKSQSEEASEASRYFSGHQNMGIPGISGRNESARTSSRRVRQR